MSRIWGVPVGPGAWEPEPVALADALATAFEVLIVGVAAVVLFRPAVAQRTLRPSLGLASIGVTGVAIAVVSTMALSPSFASEHQHSDGDDGHDNASGRIRPRPRPRGHDRRGRRSGQRRGRRGHPEHVEGHTDVVIAADGTSACEQSNVANEGNSGHGHRGPVPFEPMDAATRATLSQQIAAANTVVLKYPTVACGRGRRLPPDHALRALHRRSLPQRQPARLDVRPGQPGDPAVRGTDPDSQLVGLSYLDFNGPDNEPEGFAGKTDPWHVHRQLCIGGGGVLGDENTDEGACEAWWTCRPAGGSVDVPHVACPGLGEPLGLVQL